MDTSQLYSSTSTGSTLGDTGGRRRRSREIETLSLEIRNYPRDVLHTFISSDPNATQQQKRQSAMEEQEKEEEEDLELNLGLSLDGKFGVDKSHRGLIRASSIAGEIGFSRGEEEEEAAAAPATALARTASLPTVTEEEWRRRKATLRRMEAKRRRSEKQRSGKAEGGGKMNPVPGLPGKGKGKGGFFRSLQGLLAHQQQQGSSQESLGGNSSSGASELESKTKQGSGGFGETKSPGSSQPIQAQEGGRQSKRKDTASAGAEDMPSVFTIGDGPHGRKVEGILYKYGRGEEVRIMCVCHGSFHSPAEFVTHAGGTDVHHPLRHIVVNPSSSPFP